MYRVLKVFALLVAVSAFAAVPSLTHAAPPPLPASLELSFAQAGVVSPYSFFITQADLEQGCLDESPPTQFTASSSGAISGGCDIDLQYTNPQFNLSFHDTKTGSMSGQINTVTGVTTLNYQSFERNEITTTGKVKETTVTITVLTSQPINQFNAILGTANFSVQLICTAGTMGSGANRNCNVNESRTYSGSIGFYLNLYPLTQSDAKVDHIEVVQVVQDSGNTVPLVANKSTVARVFFNSPVSATIATITLKGIRNGTPLGGPQPTRLTGGAITIDAYLVGDRDLETESVNYLLPMAWTTPGNLDLEITFTSIGLPDNNPANNTKTQTVTFQERKVYRLKSIEICMSGGSVCDYDTTYRKPDLVEAMLPLADGGLQFSRFPAPSIVLEGELNTADARNTALWTLFDYWMNSTYYGAGNFEQILGWVSQSITNVGGTSSPPFANGNTRAVIVAWLNHDPLQAFQILAHEIAHNKDVHHTNLPDGCEASDEDTDWPYATSRTQQPGWNSTLLNVELSTQFDIMSYCYPYSQMWLSPHTYTKLFDGIGAPAAASAVAGPRVASQYLVVGGKVKADGSAAELQPAKMIFSEAVFPAASLSGSHCLRFNNTPSLDYCFDMSFEDQDGAQLTENYFLNAIPWDSLVTLDSVRLCESPCGPSDTIVEVTKSPTAPYLQNIHPAFDEVLDGPISTVSWTALDPDPGDLANLKFDVLYSHDQGQTFVPIALGISETSITFNTSDIIASPQGVFRIIVSDGLNSSEAFSAVVPVGQAYPWGDLRCDGVVDIGDVVTIKRLVAGLESPPPPGCAAVGSLVTGPSVGDVAWGDITADSVIDASDAYFITRYLAGLAIGTPGERPLIGTPTYTGR